VKNTLRSLGEEGRDDKLLQARHRLCMIPGMEFEINGRDIDAIASDVLSGYRGLYDELLRAQEPRIITIEDADFLKTISLFSALPA
jgi:hypothetical protein